MIETIYSNENGEVNHTNRLQTPIKMPKNIRQVGKSDTSKNIYVEDYVMTFIKQTEKEDYSKYNVAVLVGRIVKAENCRNIFISGVIEVEEMDTANEIIFSNNTWTSIYENIKKYFVDFEIVGWFVGGPGYLLEDENKIRKAHIDNFAGQDKTLLTFDYIEKEEAFFIYENGHLSKQEGYYIYYEKNEEMQTYMIDHKKTQSDEASYDDRVAREIRTVIHNKKPMIEDGKSISRLMYAAGTLLAVIILVVGAAMLGNYDQMKNMQDTLNSLSKNFEQVESLFPNDTVVSSSDVQGDRLNDIEDAENSVDTVDATDTVDTADTDGGEESLDVEVVSGNVESMEEEENEEVVPDEVIENNEEKPVESSEPEDSISSIDEQVSEEVKYYVVETGDTLADICIKLYSSVNYMPIIKELNSIEDTDMIYIGQKLIIP